METTFREAALTIKKSPAAKGPGEPKKTKTAASAGRTASAQKGRAAGARPKIRASHTGMPEAARAPRKRLPSPESPAARRTEDAEAPSPSERGANIAAAVRKGRAAPTGRKTPLAGPKRASKRPTPEPQAPEPSAKARELALNLAAAGIDKKAIGIEILDVTGKVDYADFLVVMTGRSDRHVHAIATGIEDAMRKRKAAPLSMEGLAAATWVLIDFGDVVVHVFQEDARLLYDIEGLWIDAGRVPVPAEPGAPEAPSPH